MLLEALRLYAGGRDCDLFSCVLARVAAVAVRLGSGGSEAVLLRFAVAFLRYGGYSFRLRRLCGGFTPAIMMIWLAVVICRGMLIMVWLYGG